MEYSFGYIFLYLGLVGLLLTGAFVEEFAEPLTIKEDVNEYSYICDLLQVLLKVPVILTS